MTQQAAPPDTLSTPLKLAQYIFADLAEDLTINDQLIPAGTSVCILPQTTAHSVRVPGNRSLLEAWSTLSTTDHSHNDHLLALAGFEEQLVLALRRLNTLEVWAAENGFTTPPAQA